jgi:putative transcriptional regulator
VIQCHLGRLMARDGLRVAEVARASGLNRSTVTSLAVGRATRVELPHVEALCRLLNCGVGDLFEYIADDRSRNDGGVTSDRETRS